MLPAILIFFVRHSGAIACARPAIAEEGGSGIDGIMDFIGIFLHGCLGGCNIGVLCQSVAIYSCVEDQSDRRRSLTRDNRKP